MAYALGRLPQFDPRSLAWPIRTLLPDKPRRSYTWRCTPTFDQANTPHCVGFGNAHELVARPVVVPAITNDTGHDIYRAAKLIDVFGPDVDGTSVLAGAQVMRQLGYWSEYRWAFGELEIALAVGYRGPVVIGVDWWTGMFDPDHDGYLKMTGQVEGGHCVLVHGYSVKSDSYRICGISWGPGWGVGGGAFIRRVDMVRLLASGGECCVPVRRTKLR